MASTTKIPKSSRTPSAIAEVSYTEVLAKALGVMDASAVAMCRDNKMPIMVFDLKSPGNIMRMAMGEPIGTMIHLAE